jgi:hypothetical protein
MHESSSSEFKTHAMLESTIFDLLSPRISILDVEVLWRGGQKLNENQCKLGHRYGDL